MTREQALHQASVMLDEIGERDIENFFEEHVYDAVIEDLLRHKVARWKKEQLQRIESLVIRMENGGDGALAGVALLKEIGW